MFLLIRPDGGVSLMDRAQASRLLSSATARRLAGLSGNLETGFSWGVAVGTFRLRHLVRPVKVVSIPAEQALRLAVVLTWPADQEGRQRTVSFSGLFPDRLIAVLAACCLWSGREGQGAVSAELRSEDGTRFHVDQPATVCGLIDEELLEALRASRLEETVHASSP